MDYFIERLCKNRIEYGNKIALSNGGVDTYSYEKVWELSGRVYGYLADKGIGKEDFVMINLPRGAEIIIVCIGVWRAGAAFVIVEDGYSKERTDFIYDDCDCKIRIAEEQYKEILNCSEKEGYEDVDLHDAAYACYTSGSTGVPKGVLHEFGVLNQDILCHYIEGEYDTNCDDIYAVLSPLNFVAGLIVFPSLLYVGGEVVIVPSQVVKNPAVLEEFYRKEKITVSFITPSLMKVFSNFNPELRLIYSASEPVINTYIDNILMYNVHAQSETGFLTTAFHIDKPYDNTPIGKTYIPDLNLRILDENCNEVPNGEIGEICFNNIYFRGYINQPEATRETFRGDVYHSGDMGKILSDGNIVILGREDDMIKINGNRIDPAEIEKTARDILGVDWAIAKCVENDGKKQIALYIKDEPKVAIFRAKEIFALKLPYYMVPAHYMMLDEIPLSENGKIARNKLPDPDFNAVSAYVPPTDEIEKKITKVFEKVLGKKKIGIDDDFYEMGGDSILSMEVIMALDRWSLSTEDIFRERTARNLSKFIRAHENFGNEVKMAQKAKDIADKGCKITKYQQFCFDRQLFSPTSRISTMLNLPVLIRYERSLIDSDKLCSAVKKAVFAHPLLLSKLCFDNDGELIQKYDESLYEELTPRELTEEEVEKEYHNLVKPFTLINKKLYDIKVINTKEHTYLFLDVHHIIADGTSMHILLRDIYKAYFGERIKKDYIYAYYGWLERRINDAYYIECKNYLNDLYDDKWSTCPMRDNAPKEYTPGYFEEEFSPDKEKIAGAFDFYGVNENGLFILATLLTLAKYNNSRKVLITWTYHGRDTKHKGNMFGLLIKDLMVGLKIERGMTLLNAAELINKQIAIGIEKSLYPYSFMNDTGYDNDRLCFLFQGGIYDFSETKALGGVKIPVPRQNYTAENSFSLQVMLREDKYYLGIDYLKECYLDESISKFKTQFFEILDYICNNFEGSIDKFLYEE